MLFRSRRIWDCGPWSFKGEHLILKQYSSDLSFNEIDFSISYFWVQVHGLPLNRQNVPSLKKVGAVLGNVLDTDLLGSGANRGKRFVRVRVDIEVHCPLLTGFPWERESLPILWIPFKYEKLGSFCYGCGILGHDVRNYPDVEVQSLWKKGLTLGIHSNWLKAEVSDFQPGIDLESLRISDIAECNLPTFSGEVRCLPATASIQVAHNSRIELQQREPMDQSKVWVEDNTKNKREAEESAVSVR